MRRPDRRVPAILALIAAGLLGGCAGPGQPNVLLIVLDTARADRFSFDGYRRDTSPRIAALASEGAVYEQAFTPAPWTVPAHASLFTGLFPSAHGTDSGHLWLDEERVTLAEAFRDGGYWTLAYTENPWVGKGYNFQQGFETFEEIWRNVPGEGEDAGAAMTNQRVEQWLSWRDGNEEARRRPFFIFINYLEPHLPYSPPEPERSRFLSAPVDREAVERLRRLKHPDEMKYILGTTDLSPADLRILSDLYDGEIAYADRRIGELADLLRRRGLLDRTVVAITSDHGEEIGEHHFLDHKMNLYEPLLRIPLVVRYPPAVKAAQRIGHPVMLQDLYPTLLALAGLVVKPAGDPDTAAAREAVPLPGIAGLEGGASRSGAGARSGGRAGPLIAEFARPVTFLDVIREADPGHDIAPWDRALVSYRVADEKLHWASDGRHRLYDLSSDPGEDHDLAAARPERVRDLARAVEAWLARPAARPPLARPTP